MITHVSMSKGQMNKRDWGLTGWVEMYRHHDRIWVTTDVPGGTATLVTKDIDEAEQRYKSQRKWLNRDIEIFF